MKVKIIGKFANYKRVCYHCVEDSSNTNKHVFVVFTTDKTFDVNDTCFVYSYCYNGNWYKKIQKGE